MQGYALTLRTINRLSERGVFDKQARMKQLGLATKVMLDLAALESRPVAPWSEVTS